MGVIDIYILQNVVSCFIRSHILYHFLSLVLCQTFSFDHEAHGICSYSEMCIILELILSVEILAVSCTNESGSIDT